MPKGLDVGHPMDGRFQVGHQDALDLTGIGGKRRHGRVGDDGDLWGLKGDGGNEGLEFIPDDPHDGRVEGHTDPQQGGPVPHLLQPAAEIFHRLSFAAQHHLVR